MSRMSSALLSRFAAVLAALSCWVACMPGAWANEGYRLGYGDVLTVTLVGQPSMSVTNQPIRPDGRISLPLVRTVAVEGKTVEEAAELVAKAYRGYLTDPKVVVQVDKFRQLKITMLGLVSHPGTFSFERPPTLVEALATAGGLQERGSKQGIKVLSPNQAPQTYDLAAILLGDQVAPVLPEGSVVEVHEIAGPDYYRLIPLVASVITAGAVLFRSW